MAAATKVKMKLEAIELSVGESNVRTLAGLLLFLAGLISAQAAELRFVTHESSLDIHIGSVRIASYVWRDEKMLRPYFAHLKVPSGLEVTRNHPPIRGTDAVDHETMHPGLWLAFGDVSGADFWRNKAKIEHVEFAEAPNVRDQAGTFAVQNRPRSGTQEICAQLCRYSIRKSASGYLLTIDSTFRAPDADFYFRDQEEMGLGVRVATPIAVKNGGRMIDSEGRINEKEIWGNSAKWCDYSGAINGQKVGITLMPHPDNLRPSWFHSRDYGALVANPFGRKAFGKGDSSRVFVKKGEVLPLRFGVFVHEGDINPNQGYANYLKVEAN